MTERDVHGKPKRPVHCAVLTFSDTRSERDDASGARIAELLVAGGHEVVHRAWAREDDEALHDAIDHAVHHTSAEVVVTTGGTGVAPRDRTPDVLAGMADRELPGFGELFRYLSWQQVGAKALLSRSMAVIIGSKPVFALPGSRQAVELAVVELILPELGHLVELARPRR